MPILNNLLSYVNDDLEKLNSNLQNMITAKHPVLYSAAEHLFNAGGKRIRPAIVFIVAKATTNKNTVLPEHRRLAEITEIIHTASLVHDDIIDDCETRRGISTVHNLFNTKIAILAGDFLFAQSSWYLANLNNLEVVKTISKVITDFAEGEVRQGLTNFDSTISIDDYIEKSFYKTASLIAASCQGATMLSRNHSSVQNDFYLYGKHIGLAFQIIDDILDIMSSSKILGKPAGSDLKNGNLTAPLIFALIEEPQLHQVIDQECKNITEMNDIIYQIKKTKGIQKAKDLAQEHIQVAIDIVHKHNINTHNNKLILMGNYIVQRLK
uniref:Prenyl transferase n=1 Tax=Plumaria plumosa TaxID=189642 RepID=A0A4D6WWH6_9FLOR|nr:Prenyl transferase [Plumaria plumosa]